MPLNEASLRDLALSYLARYATSRAKLSAYLARKVAERGWAGDMQVDIAALVEKLAGLGYIDDAAYAAMKAGALARRGYGAGRLGDIFYRDGIAEPDRSEAAAIAATARWDAAVAFARRKRIGSFASQSADPDVRRRQFAAFLRAGHDAALAKLLINLEPGVDLDLYRPQEDA